MLRLLHGAHRWDGKPEIRPPRKGRVEFGPGIYTTTGFGTAGKYAKGGGRIYAFEIQRNLTFIDGIRLPAATLFEAAGLLRNGARVTKDLERSRALQLEAGRTDDLLPVSFLVNHAVDNDAATGQSGCLLAAWLARQGISAALHPKSDTEDWVVLFDPSVIERVTPVPASEIDWENPYLPKVRDQLRAVSRPSP